MSSHSKVFNSLTRVHQRALHELYLIHNSLLSELSEETSAFLVDHPEIVREEFGTLFERDPFDFRDSNVLFYCPITRAVSDIHSSTPPPDYSSESDNSFGSAETMSAQAKKKQVKTKKDDITSDDYDNRDDNAALNADDDGTHNILKIIFLIKTILIRRLFLRVKEDLMANYFLGILKIVFMFQMFLRLGWKIPKPSRMISLRGSWPK
jgi:hypothetical protein